MDDDEFRELTPAERKALLARLAKHQRAVEDAFKKQTREMAEFVRSNVGAVVSMSMQPNVLRVGQIERAVLHIEVDADRYARFVAQKAAGRARNRRT